MTAVDIFAPLACDHRNATFEVDTFGCVSYDCHCGSHGRIQRTAAPSIEKAHRAHRIEAIVHHPEFPLCGTCRLRRVSHRRAERCSFCSMEHKRQGDRDRQARIKESKRRRFALPGSIAPSCG